MHPWLRIMRGVVAAGILALVAAVALAGDHTDESLAWRWSGVERVMVVADVHGAYGELVAVLRDTGLLDEEFCWSGGKTHLVSLGDFLDRGPDARQVMDLLMKLQEEAVAAGGRVHVVMGNHEAMNLVGDLRYVARDEYRHYARDEASSEREAAYHRFRDGQAAGLSETAARRKFLERYPLGFFGRRAAFRPEGPYGRWLLDRPALIVINRIAFVHGGLPPVVAELGGEELNRQLREELREYLSLQEELIKAGFLDPETPFARQAAQVQSHLMALDPLAGEEYSLQTLAVPRERAWRAGWRLLELFDALAFRNSGPLWYRGTSLNPEPKETPVVEAALRRLEVDRVVVGHTPTENRRATSRFGERVIRLDTGMLTSHYHGNPVFLVLEGETTRVHYPLEDISGAVEPEPVQILVEAGPSTWSDAELEEFLRTAPVIHVRELGEGITRPKQVILKQEGQEVRGIFKTVDVDIQKRVRVGDRYVARFTDRYPFEVAAYRLDRLLGLGLVPVTVLRTLDGVEGSLQLWVDDALNGQSMRKMGLKLDEAQLEAMHVFDVLIHNIDRNEGNRLYTLADQRLHLVDHSRAFRMSRTRPPGMEKTRLVLASPFAARLEALDMEELREAMDGLLSKPEIQAILSRRDRVLKEAVRREEPAAKVSRSSSPTQPSPGPIRQVALASG